MSSQTVFIALLIFGWISCTTAAGRAFKTLGPRHPICLVAMCMGIVGLVFIAGSMIGVAGMRMDGRGVALLAVFLAAKWSLAVFAALSGRPAPVRDGLRPR